MILITCLFMLLLGACEKKAGGNALSGDEGSAAGLEEKGQMEAERVAKHPNEVKLHPQLQTYVERVVDEFDTIAEERKRELRKLALFIRTKQASNEPASLTFICTHNSRRSHMSQLWAATAAAWYGANDVGTFSGGTEATAFNPRAVAALRRAGFEIDNPGGDNPHYRVTYGPGTAVMECYSKTYDDPSNPQKGFAAVMTCSQADKNCPVVMGAALRVAVPYDDPKEADATPEETQRYDERCKQIATEMFYLFSQVNA